MDKIKQIKEMVTVMKPAHRIDNDCILIDSCELMRDIMPCNLCECAKLLVNAGYGNLREFAERLESKKKDIVYRKGADTVYGTGVAIDDIDVLLKEYLDE